MRSVSLIKHVATGLALATGLTYAGNFAREMVHYKRLSLLAEQDKIKAQMAELDGDKDSMKVQLASEYLRTLEMRQCFDKAVYPFTSYTVEIASADSMYDPIDNNGLRPVFHKLFLRRPSSVKGQCGASKIVEPGGY